MIYLHCHSFHEYTHHSATYCTHSHAENEQVSWKLSLLMCSLPYTYCIYLHCHLFHEYTHHSAPYCTHCHAGNEQTSWNLKHTINIRVFECFFFSFIFLMTLTASTQIAIHTSLIASHINNVTETF